MLLTCLDACEASIVASCVEAFAASCASIVARFWSLWAAMVSDVDPFEEGFQHPSHRAHRCHISLP